MFKLSDKGVEFVKKELERYETKRSAIIPCLYRIQEENGGWVSPDAVSYLAELTGIPVVHINEVLYFYTMFNKKPVGKLHVQVCCNISCSMNGGREITQHICEKYNVKPEDISEDGLITVSKVECLGSCGTAPMMQVNEDYHENLTKEKAVEVIEELKRNFHN